MQRDGNSWLYLCVNIEGRHGREYINKHCGRIDGNHWCARNVYWNYFNSLQI